MEWLTAIRKSIDYIEEHLNDNISARMWQSKCMYPLCIFKEVF